jgi:hypothetical protein
VPIEFLMAKIYTFFVAFVSIFALLSLDFFGTFSEAKEAPKNYKATSNINIMQEKSFSDKTNFAQYYRSNFSINKRYNKKKKEQVFSVGGNVSVFLPRSTSKPTIAINNSEKLMEEKFFYQPIYYTKWNGDRGKVSGGDETIRFQYVAYSVNSGKLLHESWGTRNIVETNYYDLPISLRESMRGMREGEARLIVVSGALASLKEGAGSFSLPRVSDNDSIALLVNLTKVSSSPGISSGTSGGSSLSPSAEGTVNPLTEMKTEKKYPREMFGLHAPWSLDDKKPNWDGDWPSVNFGALRLWDTQTTWNVLEPAKGRFHWARLDKLVTQAEKNNINNITLVLAGTPSWAASRPAPGSAPWIGTDSAAVPNDKDWTDFLSAVAQRYKGRINSYQIWNEPNSPVFWQGTPEELAKTVSLANETIKRIDPSASVISPGFAASERFSPNSSRRFWEALAVAGFPFDVAALHVYPSPRQGLAGFKSLLVHSRDIIVLNGWTGPLWVTETSFWQREDNDTVSAQTVRNLVAGAYLEAAKFDVDRMFWYAWMPSEGLSYDHRLFLTMQPGTAGTAGFNDVYQFLTGQVGAAWGFGRGQCRFEGYCNATQWDGQKWVVPSCRDSYGASWGQLGCGEMHVCIKEVCN